MDATHPFIDIVESEARHIEALQALFQRYGSGLPSHLCAGRVPRFASPREAFQAGVDAEVEDSALCERLMGSTMREDTLARRGTTRRPS